ncbi:hypothetical protein BC829DRAFT_406237, partial [Chytridium lagenaria]
TTGSTDGTPTSATPTHHSSSASHHHHHHHHHLHSPGGGNSSTHSNGRRRVGTRTIRKLQLPDGIVVPGLTPTSPSLRSHPASSDSSTPSTTRVLLIGRSTSTSFEPSPASAPAIIDTPLPAAPRVSPSSPSSIASAPASHLSPPSPSVQKVSPTTPSSASAASSVSTLSNQYKAKVVAAVTASSGAGVGAKLPQVTVSTA